MPSPNASLSQRQTMVWLLSVANRGGQVVGVEIRNVFLFDAAVVSQPLFNLDQ